DDDGALALGEPRRLTPLPRETDQRIAAHTRVLLLPCRREGRGLIVVAGRILARQTARYAVLGHHQVVHGGESDNLAAHGFDTPDRNTPAVGRPFTEVVEAHLDHFAALLQERQGRVDAAPGESVLERQVPFALVLGPAAAAATHGHFRLGLGHLPNEKLPVAVLDALIARNAVRSKQLAGLEYAIALHQFHQVGEVRVLLCIVHEIRDLLLVVALLENDVTGRHPP